MHTPHPRRVQVTGDMFHPHLPDRAHWAGRQRPGLAKSPFANPHPVDAGRKTPCPICGIRHTLAEAISLYRQHLDQNPDLVCLAAAVDVRFACRCPLDQPCHVDELLARADQVTVIALGDDRDTKFIVQTIAVSTGECSHGHGSCRKPGVIAVRNTIDQQHPTEVSTLRVTVCADHRDDAVRMRAAWEADARELQDPIKNAEFLASVGVTD
ncbi:DUF4326 domain-containing protein [Streptantibioticus rubrisoli]|uniref:DUF4326 domain-containing protein n=1 Tax=Streptantibioticus rubrisoli TaxID=1387313 RepID=A0ABT1PER8_9ACTN|nr:DUF4326 domain-containing protein [Streptantibioticus rubrisoli]MCQ4043852.1 DUF4326 domain-containing protein [Streptantibioticus rubrisoli]